MLRATLLTKIFPLRFRSPPFTTTAFVNQSLQAGSRELRMGAGGLVKQTLAALSVLRIARFPFPSPESPRCLRHCNSLYDRSLDADPPQRAHIISPAAIFLTASAANKSLLTRMRFAAVYWIIYMREKSREAKLNLTRAEWRKWKRNSSRHSRVTICIWWLF